MAVARFTNLGGKKMYTRRATIMNDQGMHIRPAQLLTEKAAQFSSEITIHSGEGQDADAKSILGIMSLGLEKGAVVTLTAQGDDEKEAVETLAEMFTKGFGEL
jgi:phosphocarrier protein HPr